MKKQTQMITGSLASLALVAGTGGALAMPLAHTAFGDTGGNAGVESESATTIDDNVAVSIVEGQFSYTQDELTPNAKIAGMFCKAASSMCASLQTYCADIAPEIHVTGNVGNEFSATVAQMSDDSEAASVIMACACASNGPGGGAVINAKVEGVTLESIAAMAKVK